MLSSRTHLSGRSQGVTSVEMVVMLAILVVGTALIVMILLYGR